MNPEDSDSNREEVHRGHDLEAGLLARVREWTDVIPWLRLGRTLRVAGSPPLVFLMATTFAVWWIGQSLMLDRPSSRAAVIVELGTMPQQSISNLRGYFHGLMPTSIFDPGSGTGRWRAPLGMLWALLVWTPAAMLLVRQGALLTAGRNMVGLKPGISLVVARTPAAWLSAIVPLACVFAMGIAIVVLGWISRTVVGIAPIEYLLAIAVVVIAIPCGILAFGANVAVPLSWAALVNERDPDTLDSLSRGYEYLFRRPLRLAMYVLVSLVILLVVGYLASAIAWSASAVAAGLLGMSGSEEGVPNMAIWLLRYLPTVVVLTSAWSLVGGVYLLLRCDAGGQEVEDIWEPTPPSNPSFPQLPETQN